MSKNPTETPRLARTPEGEFLLDGLVIDLGFAIGTKEHGLSIRLTTETSSVIEARIALGAAKRFARELFLMTTTQAERAELLRTHGPKP